MDEDETDWEDEQAIQLEEEARKDDQGPVDDNWLEDEEAAPRVPRANVRSRRQGHNVPNYEDAEVSSDGEEQDEFDARGQGGGGGSGTRPAPRFLGQNGGGANDGGSSASTNASRLHQGLDHVPGWSPQIMGAGIVARPPVFTTGLPGYWVQYSDNLFPPGAKCRPARVIDMGFVGSWQQASDAERISDMTAQTEAVARARTVATCALMGLLSVGMAKGYVASPNHSELTEAKKKDPEEFSKERKKLNGKVKTYTYCPNAASADPVQAMETAMMFCFVHIAMHDPAGKYIGFKILMLIFDKGFSTDALVAEVMKENALIRSSGQINGMPECDRTTKMERQNKLQRTQITDENLETTAGTQYKRICSNQDYLKFVDIVGAQTPGQVSVPYYANIGKDTPPGCVIHPFVKHHNDEWGGQHPIGPTVSHNHKRYAAPSEDSPGINVSIAGTLDARGKPLELHESLVDPRMWYDADTGDFTPPQHVIDNGWCHICHDPSVTNIFNAPLPNKMHGNVEPDDCLLQIFWKKHKDSNPILKNAQARGLTTFVQNRDAVLSLFHRMEDALDPNQQKLARAVLETEMLSNDSIDKSVAEEAILERRAYGKTTTEKHGDMWVLSVRQILRDISIEQEKVHSMVSEWDKEQRAEVRNADYEAHQAQYLVFDVKAETQRRREEHAKAVLATITLGLQRFEHAYGRAKARKSIPPGYYDVASTGLKTVVKEAGAIALRLSGGNLGRPVNPDDPNSLLGTANIAFAHKQSLVATDVTPFGHHRAFLTNLFSSGLNIAGRDVKLMMEMHVHAFEPFQEVSFFLLLCGGPGSGKSMRAKRMMALLPDGWIKPSGSSSAKAGMNGGMDFLCGRLVYYDEITNDFGSNDSERIEYLKSITMEQRVLNTRTVKTVGEGGLEGFTTVVLDSLHYESHLICTNCGPLGLKADVEPSTNRAALSDRSWAHIVHSNDDHESGDVDFDPQKCSDDLKQQINRYQVCACLVAYLLIFIKHIPSCRPNLTFANVLCNKWYEILWNEYNLPRPSKRKKLKLRMMLELFAIESAVFEKFVLPESAVDFTDMRPDATGQLSSFCIEQLADVVRSLQRCLDLEVIHTAFSHSLDHSPATSAHVFQMKTVLAQLHGSELDRRILSGKEPAPSQAPPQAPPQVSPQGLGPETDPNPPACYDPEILDAMGADYDEFDQQFRPAAAPPPPPPPPPPANSVPLGMEPGPSSMPGPSAAAPTPGPGPGPTQPRAGLPDHWEQRNSVPIGQTTNEHGQTNNTGDVVTHQVMEGGMTRQKCAETARELAITRELRCELSNRALTRKIARDGAGEYQQLTKLFTDWSGEDREPKHRMTSTGAVISAKRAAGACMPNASDLMDRGMEEGFLKNIACGQKTTAFHDEGARIGIGTNRWEYETLPGEVVLKGPADFDFHWARLSAFSRGGGAEMAAGGGPKQKSLWTNSARLIKAASASGTIFSLMAAYSMSLESMRDVLFMIAWAAVENKIRIPKKVSRMRFLDQHSGPGKSNQAFNISDSCMRSNNQGFSDTKSVKEIHPKSMFVETNGVLHLDPAFASPVHIERPLNFVVGNSLGQKRLDHLTDNRALPVCIAPEGFERGTPIKECESFNGIYFNKHTASEQAALNLEMGLYLANVPGIAGGKYSTVPESFKADPNPNPGREENRLEAEAELAETRQQHAAAPGSADVAMADARDASSPVMAGEDDFGLDLDETQTVEVEDDDCDFVETEDSPHMEGDTHLDHESVQRSVTHPDSEETGVNPEPGATDRAAKASVDPGAMVPALPFEWDQLAMFFSLKMVETLHNDVHSYVDKFRDSFQDVYGDEEREETLAGLPQITLRFPGVVDLKDAKVEECEEKTPTLQPLSCGIPLAQSRYCDVGKQMKSSRASKGLTEAVHSFAHGRAIAFNDPEVLEQEAEARGIDAGIAMEGNLFARSTWQRFTLSALDSRGMRTPEEELRVNDQGLCMRLRVRNHRGVSQHPDADPDLDGCTEARAHTFTAQQRQKRKIGEGGSEETPMEGLGCKRRSLEREREREMVEESMDLDPSV